MSGTIHSYVFGKALVDNGRAEYCRVTVRLQLLSVNVAVSLFQAAFVTLAIFTFSLMVTILLFVALAWVQPAPFGADHALGTEMDAFQALPEWMTRMQLAIVSLAMPVCVFVSLLFRNSRAAMWWCAGVVVAVLVVIEAIAIVNDGDGILLSGFVDSTGLSDFLLPLMLVQWLAFRSFLWAAGVKTLWR